MRSRSALLAWLLVAVSVACVVGDTVLTAASSPLLSEEAIAQHGWPLVPGAALGSSIMGALIVTSRPRHLIGWLLVTVGATSTTSLITESYHLWMVHERGDDIATMAHVAGWVSVLLGAPIALTCLTIMFLVAPDGHLLSRRWRYAAAASIAGLAAYTIALMSIPPTTFLINGDVGVTEGAAVLAPVGLALIGGALVASVVSMVRRLRRAQGAVRQQLRWISASAASIAVGLAWLFGVGALNGGEQTFLASGPLFLAYFLLPIVTAVAVLRHQLFDIDLIINRALVLGLAALIVATGYVGLVVALGSALGAWAEGFWPSLLAFAVVAMGFQPLRRRVLRLADRVAYGPRAVPYEALAAFSRGLGDQPDLDLLLPCVAETAADAVSAKSASVRLEMSGGAQHTRRWPQTSEGGASEDSVDGGEDAIPVTDRSGRLGSICVTMPAGRPLRPDEHQLLADLADQTAIAFRNARMEAELAAHVSVLDARNEELEASRRRLIEAGDAERRRLEAAIAREVLPSLADLPGAVDDARASLATGAPAESIDMLVDAATDALEALRDLTRGVFPTVLARSGLGPALSAYVARTGCSARLVMEPSLADRRFSARVEAAAYFCATEALPNDACADEVRLRLDGPDLVVVVRGRRRGDMDLQAMVDRVEALAGTLDVDDPADGVIRLTVRIPVQHAAQPALQGSG
jgi:signal transduction histidine kinase